MPNIILSIVIPNYNGSRFLRELLSQLKSIRFREKIQLIIIDGGSGDNSFDVARSFKMTQDIVISEADNGQSDAIAKGLRIASGRWFMFQNSDDLFHTPTLEKFLSNSDGYDLFDVIAFNQATSELEGTYWRDKLAFAHTHPISWRQLSQNIYYTNQSTIYNTEKAKLIGFNPALQFAMDYDFVVRFFKANKPKVAIIHDILGIQRMHPDTKTNRMANICDIETKKIRSNEFSLCDRFLGLIIAVIYHVHKRFIYLFNGIQFK